MITVGYRWLRRVTRDYSRLQVVTEGYTRLP